MGDVRQASTRFSIVKRSAGQSAVEKASYISRSVLVSEYDGQTYRPKYKEDLVHCEVSLPENAPPEFADRSVLWNSVERVEKYGRAQLARMMKASLPNEWSYETAVDAVRDYVQRNFVSTGMIADWSIHDSENDKGERNLHFHVLLTMRPIEPDGTWGAKQRKVYVLDSDGNRVKNKNGRGYRCTSEQTTDWNSPENAKKWRKDLADTVNAVNEKLGVDVLWEHRSYKEQGMDIEPTIHLGARAASLERMGIATERGDINRAIRRRNMELAAAKTDALKAIKEHLLVTFRNVSHAVGEAKNEVADMIVRVTERKGRLDLPIVSTSYIGKVSDRPTLQSGENALQFIEDKKIDSFEKLAAYSAEKGKKYQGMEHAMQSKTKQRVHLKELAEAYAMYSEYNAVYQESQSLKGRAKAKYDREHSLEIEAYPSVRYRMTHLLEDGEKMSPKEWEREAKSLQADCAKIRKEQAALAVNLAQAEVIDYNRRNLEREMENEKADAERQGAHARKGEIL